MRVLLADDHALVRSGIRALLEADGAVVVAEASNGIEAVRLAHETSPEVAFVDVAMPEMSGIEAARRIHEAHPEIRIVMLSMHAERLYVSEATRVGASGYVAKDAASYELAGAIEAALAGDVYLSSAAESAGREVPTSDADAPAGEIDCLTERERQVLQLIAEGLSSSEIGIALGIGVRTVDSHRQNVMGKLGIRTIAELTKCAVRNGLCDLASRDPNR